MDIEKGVYTFQDLVDLCGSRRRAESAIAEGELLKISHGLYSNVTDPSQEAFLVLSKYYPGAVISGSSSLLYQELSDRMDEKIHVDVARETHMRESDFFEFHRVSSNQLTGIEEKNLNGVMVKIYSRERALFEAQKYSRPSLHYAVKSYVEGGVNMPELNRLHEIFGGDVVMLVLHHKSDASF